MNKKTAIATAFILSAVFITPSAHASVFGDIQNNFTQAINRILEVTGFIVSEKKPEPVVTADNSAPAAEQKESAVGPGGAIYTISGGEGYPVFEKELTVEPAHSEKGKPQTFTVWVKDPSGVAIVKAIVSTDKGDKEVILSLSGGDGKEGRWKGSWNAENVQAGQYYKVMFQAVGKSGGKAEMPFLSKARTK